MDIEEKRGVEEAYASASISSNLRVEADRRGDIDVIIAAGWNESRIGGALLRLHSEFDSAERPRAATSEQFLKAGKTTREQRTHAARQAHAFNLHATELLLGKMKTLPDVRAQTALQLAKWGVEEAETKGMQVIRWWLQQNCPTCHGTKFQVVPGTHRHNGKACPTCSGTGVREIPYGQHGRRCANWMDQCVERARASIGRRLRSDCKAQ